MHITVKRPTVCASKTCTISECFIDNSTVRECYILEDIVREIPGRPVSEWKIKSETAIPAGTYKVVLSYSPHFNTVMPEILAVPGFSGVRIHAGNTAADTEGCLICGHEIGADGESVLHSRDARNDLVGKIHVAIACGNPVTITIG